LLLKGNILITDDGDVGLIDFGQVKQLSNSYRRTIANIVITLNERDDSSTYLETLKDLVLDLGVELNEDAKPEAGAAIAMWLFDGKVEKLPGGYDIGELSPNSPVKEIKVFPQDLVLVARSVILIKAFSNRFNIRWSLADEWAPIAREVLCGTASTQKSPSRLRKLLSGVRQRGQKAAMRILYTLPPRFRSRFASVLASQFGRAYHYLHLSSTSSP
jgi:predicted unusual protein kinase regulating ubiquinone biosynthesis (AarF/ABC1/UbiB family)